MVAPFQMCDRSSRASIASLTTKKLQSILHSEDSGRASEHKAIKDKPALAAYLLSLPDFNYCRWARAWARRRGNVLLAAIQLVGKQERLLGGKS